MKRFLIPLALFAVLVAFLAVGLNRNPHDVPSPLVGKPAPDFQVPQLAPGKTFSPQDMKGKVWLLNVWSSWCVSCRQEHPLLVAFAGQSHIPVVGLSYKEVRGDDELSGKKFTEEEEMTLVRRRAAAWLAQHGSPYVAVPLDFNGRVAINYGVYGVPETYLIDKAGIIRYKQTGPLTPEALETKILPLAAQLEKNP